MRNFCYCDVVRVAATGSVGRFGGAPPVRTIISKPKKTIKMSVVRKNRSCSLVFIAKVYRVDRCL